MGSTAHETAMYEYVVECHFDFLPHQFLLQGIQVWHCTYESRKYSVSSKLLNPCSVVAPFSPWGFGSDPTITVNYNKHQLSHPSIPRLIQQKPMPSALLRPPPPCRGLRYCTSTYGDETFDVEDTYTHRVTSTVHQES